MNAIVGGINRFEPIKHIHCESAHDLIRKLSPIGPIFVGFKPGHEWIFRGVKKDSYHLVPAALRPERFDEWVQLAQPPAWFKEKQNLNAAQVLAEALSLGKFLNGLDTNGLPIPNDSPEVRRRLSTIIDASMIQCRESER